MQSNWKKIFAIIWTGQFFSLLSSTVVGYAVVLWLSMETGSAEMLAYGTIAALLPQAVLGLFTGVYIDRWNRKLTMILSDSFIAVSTLLLALLFWLGEAQLWHIFFLLTLRSIGSAFHMPAMQASVPLLAPKEELTRIAGISQMIQSVCNIGGPAIAALLIGWMEMGSILLFDVAGAAIACISLLFVKIPNPERKDKAAKVQLWKETREGLYEIRRHRGMPWLFLFSTGAMFFIMPVSAIFPLMTLHHFGGTTFQVGLVEVVWGGGALLGGFLMGVRNYKVNKVLLINLMYVWIGTSFLVSGLLPASGFVWFMVLTAIGGVSGAVYQASFISVVQTKIDPAVLGRVLSLFFSFSLFPSVVGLMATGFVADTIGFGHTFVICGAMNCLIGVFACFMPSVLKLGK